ncbi:hypothetical protein [Microbacterium flavescens]|uniref:hypothetical protein n=1 Tax=Microbacterium flavescens TaxID=69366 RepID=UPI001BDE603A|nr:hypothetical protein [Microbacterium flavescens]
MITERFRRPRSASEADRDTIYAPGLSPAHESAPVTWSPSALNARLDAEAALRALPRRPWGISADARAQISRVVAQVERRHLSLRAATAELRDLATRLHQHRLVEAANRAPRAWELLPRYAHSR